MTLPPDQGRARGLYDEQLQRLQQEKKLAAGERSLLFRSEESSAPARNVETGAD